MSKRTTTRWYIGAWVLAVLVGIATGLMARGAPAGSPPPGVTIASLVLVACGVVMFVMWIGALVRLAQQHGWGWVIGVVVLQLIFLGIVRMAAFAIAGARGTAQ